MRVDYFIHKLQGLRLSYGNVEVVEREYGDPAEAWFDGDVRDGVIYVG